MKNNKWKIRKIAIVSIFILAVGAQFFAIKKYIKDSNPYKEIQHPLGDDAIKNGVVVDENMDKRDIDAKTFGNITTKIKEKHKKKKDEHYYTLGDLGSIAVRMKPVVLPMPPEGLTVDNITRVPSPINQNSLNKPFKKYVVFYPQHQDDEVLWAGSAIRAAINERGADHVFIALVSSGTGHKIFKEGHFKNMTLKEKAEYRNREFLESCKSLGIPRKNIFFLYKERSDWKTDFNFERKFALKMEKKYKSVTHITHSYKYDDHFMHRANGETLYKLWKNGGIDDLRFFIKPFLLKYVDAENNYLNVYSVHTQKDYDMVKNACKAYKYVNFDKARYGIGYKTDYMSFDKLVYDRNERSFIIVQNNKKRG